MKRNEICAKAILELLENLWSKNLSEMFIITFFLEMRESKLFSFFRKPGWRSYSFFLFSGVCVYTLLSFKMNERKSFFGIEKNSVVSIYLYMYCIYLFTFRRSATKYTQVNISLRSINLYKHEDRNIDTHAVDECCVKTHTHMSKKRERSKSKGSLRSEERWKSNVMWCCSRSICTKMPEFFYLLLCLSHYLQLREHTRNSHLGSFCP